MKASTCFTISCTSIFLFIVFSNSFFISNLSLHSVTLKTNPIPEISNNNPQLLSIHDFTPPLNKTEEERIAWFRKKLPDFQIFESNRLTKQFDKRVQEFYQKSCEIRFFMTWISPAKLFKNRELLSMESLFKSHPNGCLIIISQTMDSKNGFKIMKSIVEKGFRVQAITPDFDFLLKNTPAESWFNEMKTGEKDPGEIPLAQNLSNLLRLAILYKYGGVYIDTDFIILKKISNLKNSIGAQSMDSSGKNWTRLNNAILVFDKNHPLLYKFIEEFADTFDGNKWGHNGPYLVSRVVERIANRPDFDFTILPPLAFYPVDWRRIGGIFRRPENGVDSKWVEAKLIQLKEETYGVHLWNKQSSKMRIEERSIIGRLISNHCIICKHIYV